MFVYPKAYQVIVVGAGHAGIEAALASARLGCSTLLLTMNCDTIGQMSCNPAIGGLGKGHLVREIDALGGEMGLATDMTGIQFRMLNRKKGPSVWAPRAQCDKKAYQFRMKWVCEREPNLDIQQAQTIAVVSDQGTVIGVRTSLEVEYRGQCVVITTGTFLRGLMHIGANQTSGGRAGEGAARNLSESLRELGLELCRLKTGTPPRLLRRSLDFERTEVQPGDDPPPPFSHWNEDLFHVEQSENGSSVGDSNRGFPVLPGLARTRSDQFFTLERFPGVPSGSTGGQGEQSRFPAGSVLSQIGGQLPCYVTYTTERTAEIIRANLHRSPLYGGVIEGVGPRYCPSIEDKIVRFADKERHQIFLEPEGFSTDEIYLNGASTSLPFEVQIELVRSIVGCEQAEILRPAYAVEYDFVPPTQIQASLETKVCRNLFLAGQINGTSGYEEAAAQGLMAGINAARRALGREAVVLRRDQAYIGVLIDDLVTKGTLEPYRMFTSRAEFRLLLRQDNADFRLSRLGHQLGLLPSRRFAAFEAKEAAVQRELTRLSVTRAGTVTLEQLLRRPEVSYDQLPGRPPDVPSWVAEEVEIQIKYQGYIEREQAAVERFRSLEDLRIPEGFDYETVPSLRREARQKLSAIQPATLGQAGRISGVNPSDTAILLVWLRRSPKRSDSPTVPVQKGPDTADP